MRRVACLPSGRAWVLVVGVLAGCLEQTDPTAPPGRPPVDARPPLDIREVSDGHVDPRDVALTPDAASAMDTDPPDMRPVPDAVADAATLSAADAAHVPDAAPADAAVEIARPMIDECFGMLLAGAPFVADYSAFEPMLGRHCRGTDHQEIVDVQQVVFVGDALTTGRDEGVIRLTAPMRARLADLLAERYALEAPEAAWQSLDPLNGRPAVRRSGDFVTCAAPSARASDLLDGSRLLANCLLPDEHGLRTLFVVTVGTGDLLRMTALIADGADDAEVFSFAGEPVAALGRAVRWMKDPARFPAGSFVVFSNVPDWTDGRADTAACLRWPALPDERKPLFSRTIAHLNGQYMRIAVENQADLVFMQEHFCGHGRLFRNPDPLCLGRPETWVDESCVFLMPPGDAALAGLFWDVITDAE